MLPVRKDVPEPGKTGLSQSGTNDEQPIKGNCACLDSVRTPSVRELCKAKAVKYSRIKCVVFREGAGKTTLSFKIQPSIIWKRNNSKT